MLFLRLVHENKLVSLASGNHWTSTEYSANNSYNVNTNNGNINNNNKNNNNNVLAMLVY